MSNENNNNSEDAGGERARRMSALLQSLKEQFDKPEHQKVEAAYLKHPDDVVLQHRVLGARVKADNFIQNFQAWIDSAWEEMQGDKK
jgi:hypothetical protein